MKMRRFAALASIILTGLALSGCSQITVGVTGVTIAKGDVYAVVGMCPNVTANEVHMIPPGGQFVLIPHPSWHFNSSESASIDLGTETHFLKLVGDKTQGLQTTASENAGGYLRFSSADIADLRSGQILVNTPTYDDVQTVDAKGFRTLVATLCSHVG
jgi:hypothetical protein